MSFRVLEYMQTNREEVAKRAETPTVQMLARLIAYYGVRNSELENLHVHNITDPEMRTLMLDVEQQIAMYLARLIEERVIAVFGGMFSDEQLGDWHNIIRNGPSYDLKDYR